MKANLNRRQILRGTAVVSVAGLAATPTYSGPTEAVEAMMQHILPAPAGFVSVREEDVKRLCELTYTPYASHWANR